MPGTEYDDSRNRTYGPVPGVVDRTLLVGAVGLGDVRVPLAEAIDTTGLVDELLLAREERVALRADVEVDATIR
jgi:hypothetical protein